MSEKPRDLIPEGSRAVFRYGLPWDSSSDICAQLYPRTGQVVIVGRADWDPFASDMTLEERTEAAMPVTYCATFPDGFVGGAFEDELTPETEG